jgi:serine phosphatase RsbU (regulator of sigma subunit)
MLDRSHRTVVPSFFHFRHKDAPPLVEPVPTVFPQIAGCDIAAVFAGKRIAGDFYDSVRVSPQRVLIGMLDVAGRREENRKILTAAQDIFRNSGVELLSPPDVNEADALTELTLRLNRGITEAAARVLSCPAFVACYHEEFGTLCYANAGHTPGFLRDGSGIIELGSTGLPLGLFSHATAEARIVAMQKGSSLLLCSRGVLECEGSEGRQLEEFGSNRVKVLFAGATATKAQDLCTAILNSAATFSHDAPLCDDRTALALIRNL